MSEHRGAVFPEPKGTGSPPLEATSNSQSKDAPPDRQSHSGRHTWGRALTPMWPWMGSRAALSLSSCCQRIEASPP